MTTKKTRKMTASALEGRSPGRQNDDAAGDVRANSKAAAIIALLKREGGATLEEMMDATGWQKHSVRGFMAGALKKRHGFTAISEKTDQGRNYRLAGEAQS